MKAQAAKAAAAAIHSCAHVIDLKVEVSSTDFAKGQFPLCDFNPDNGVKHPAITPN
jgi:hypothetical protein